MHIVHVGVAPAADTLFGPVRAVTAYARQEVQLGHRVTMVQMSPRASREEATNADGIASITLPVPRLTTALGPTARRFFAHNECAADVFHFHSSYARHWAAAARSPVPYVVSPHGAYLPLNRRRTRLRSIVFRALIGRRYLRNAAFVHAITPDEARTLREYAGARTAIEVIPNAMQGSFTFDGDERSSQRAELGIAENESVLLYIGRMDVFGKGLDVLFPAYHRAHAARGGGVHLVCVGPRDPHWRDDVENAGDVRFMQPAMGAEKRRLLAAADAFVTLSRWDVMPTAVLDALDSGLPLVVTNQTGFADFVQRTGVGSVVGLNRDEVARTLAAVAPVEPAERARIYQVAADEFHPTRIAEAFVAAYERVLSGSRAVASV